MPEYVTYSSAVLALSLVAAICAIILILLDRKAAASAMCAAFVAMAIIGNMGKFKSFELFSIKAELDSKINEAKDLLNQIRDLSLLVAKAGYSTVGLGLFNRSGALTSTINSSRDYDTIVKTLNLSANEITEMKRPIIRAMGYRVWLSFINVGARILLERPNSDDPRGKYLAAKNTSETTASLHNGNILIDTEEDLRKVLWQYLPDGMLDDQKAVAAAYVEKMIDIFRQCKEYGGPTPDYLSLERRMIINYEYMIVAKAIYNGKYSLQ